MIVLNSFKVDDAFGIADYKEALGNFSTYKAILNTFKLAFSVLGGTLLVGGGLAFICEKTNFKYKKIVDFFVFLSFTIPSYILSVSWIQMTCRGGYFHRIIEKIFPLFEYNFNTYSLESSIIVLIVHLYPVAYFGISNALKKMNGSMEKSARVCGSTNLRILFTIIIPLIIPSIVSIGLMVISRSMANFGVVAQLALPVGEEVLTTRIFSAMSQLNLSLVSVLSIILMLISYFFFISSEKIISKNRYFLSDLKNTEGKYCIKLGKWNFFINGLVSLFFIFTTFIPLITILISSFLKRWGLKVNFENMTFKNYSIVFFDNHLIRSSLFNSISYGIIAATLAAGVGSLIVYFYKNLGNKKSKLLMNMSQLSITVPNMILGIGAMYAWINEPIKLYGTKWIIIVSYIVLFIPIIIKQIKGLSDNIDESIDKSARTMGIPVIKRFSKLFLPLVNKGIASGWIICFLIALREIPISILLYSKGTETIGVMLFTVQSNSYGLEMTSTIAVVVIIVSIIGNIFIKKIGVRRFKV
ncbi:MAG: ABC transporter permease subunit [Bacillota bacterium]|nr:ABC transporter permease subunit [Bacillota bacterium]